MSIDTRRYASELMNIAIGENAVDKFFNQIYLINEKINLDESFKNYLDNPEISTQDKKDYLFDTFKSALSEDVINAFFLMNNAIKKTHTEIMLVQDFIDIYYATNGILFGTVYSARPLSESQMAKIEKAVSDKSQQKTKLQNKIDSSLIGGIKVVIDDEVWEDSVKSKLNDLKASLLVNDTLSIDTKEVSNNIKKTLSNYQKKDSVSIVTGATVGYVKSVADGIVYVSGIYNAMATELLQIGNTMAMVMNLEEDQIAAILLGDADDVSEGSQVVSTGKVCQVPVGDALIGRVVDALGRPIDSKGVIKTSTYYPIERNAHGVIERQSVYQPLQTGLTIIDSMIPIGKGQRELIIGDRQTGKTAIAVDTILNQAGKNVKCIYVAIGQKNSTVAQIVETFRQNGAMAYTTVVVAGASEYASLQYIAPYAGCSIAEYWMEKGDDVLIVYDDLSKHAIAYRTLSLLLKRSPGREAYPGDVFFLHSRLLERSAKLSEQLGGGSITALPIVETQAGDISAYIPTNIISITDGQIFLQTEMFNSGIRPAVDSGLSVSRVGSAAQNKAMKKLSSSLKLELAQYHEVLDFAQFGSDVDAATKKSIEHGKRLTEVLRQPQYAPYDVIDEILILFACQKGLIDDIETTKLKDYQERLLLEMHSAHHDLIEKIEDKYVIDATLDKQLMDVMYQFTSLYRRGM